MWNKHSRICLIPKFSLKIKNFKFGTRPVLFGYFWTGIWKQYCHIWKHHTRICLAAKLREKTKMPKFGTPNVLFGYFWDRISKKWDQKCLIGYFWCWMLKNYFRIWNQHPQICQIWVFKSYSEFWYRVHFF